MQRFWKSLTLVIAAGIISACGGGGGSSDPRTGSLSIALTDGPADDAMEVHVLITGLTVKRDGVDPVDIVFSEPLDIDLLTLTGSNTIMLLNNEPMVAGRYQWIALNVDGELDGDLVGSYVVDGMGGTVDLEIPSGPQSGLRLVSGFVITVGQNTSFVIEWDLRQGLVTRPGRDSWLLRPALRITDVTAFGTLIGMVDGTLLSDASCNGNTVYVFEGDVVPDDIDMDEMDGSNPFTTAPVTMEGNGGYSYEVNFLDPGVYTVALTCQSESDLVETSEDIAFIAPIDDMPVIIVDDEVTIVDF